MQSHQFGFKISFEPSPEFSLEDVIPVFHRFVRDHVLTDDIMIDVADYLHVPDGPGVILVCHEGHLVVEHRANDWSMSYQRKRGGSGQSLERRLSTPLGRLLGAALALEDDLDLRGKVRFQTPRLKFQIQDRLHSANDDATFAAVEPALRSLLGTLYDGHEVQLERVGELRALFNLVIRTGASPSLHELEQRVPREPN